MTNCCECGKRFKGGVRNNEVVFYDGQYYCRDCFERNYFRCDDCGEIHPRTEIHFTYDDRYICDNCAENGYIRCSDCGYLVPEDDTYQTWEDRDICPNCEEDYYKCDNCGRYVHRDDTYEYEGYYYCRDCYDSLDKTIYDYHDFDDFYIHRMPDEDNKIPAFGFEIEVAGNRNYASEVNDKLKGHAVLMNDSSVDGFEIVTQPMTEQYFTTVFMPILEDTMKYLNEKGFKGHNRGGIHIHVDQYSFDIHMIRNLVNILYGSELDRNTWLALSQRKKCEMDSWARMTGNRPYEDIDMYQCIDYERHTALNYDDRTGTYEFRIFNSNTRVERILKNFEIVLALMAYAKEEDEGYADTKGFLRYIDSRKLFYPNLSAFMQEKGIIEHYNKIYTEEELEVA